MSRAYKRALSETSEGDDDDWEERAVEMTGRPVSYAPAHNAKTSMPPRPRRAAAEPAQPAPRSLRLTVKAPPSRLREVAYADDDAPVPASRRPLARNSKNKRPIIDHDSGDEDDDEDAAEQDEAASADPDEDDGMNEEDEDEDEEEGDTEMRDAAGDEGDEDEDENDVDDDEEEEEEEEGEEEEEDENEEDDDDDDDEDEEDEGSVAQPREPPKIKISAPRKPSPQRVLNTGSRKIKSVEEREMELDSDALSDGEDDSADPGNQVLYDDDDDDMDDRDDVIAADDIDSDELGSEESGALDATKLTRRQRQASPDTLMALPNEAQKKKFYTDEQLSLRKTEMARRRKDLSVKRNEEEKADTLRRLLEKPAGPKRRSKAQVIADAEAEEFGIRRGTPGQEEDIPEVKKGFARTVISTNGTRVGVPHEWMGKQVGQMFDKPQPSQHMKPMPPGVLVEVIE